MEGALHKGHASLQIMAQLKDWMMHCFKQAVPASNINIYQQRILYFIALKVNGSCFNALVHKMI